MERVEASHGQDYYLATRVTREGEEGGTSLRVEDIARVLNHRAKDIRKYLILDCCFSGSAAWHFQGSPGVLQLSRTMDAFPRRGTAILCSSSARDVSFSPAGKDYSIFTEGMLNVLRNGDATAGESLSLDAIGEYIQEYIKENYSDRMMRPEVHSPDQRDGDLSRVPLFPNPAVRDLGSSISLEEHNRSAQRPRYKKTLARLGRLIEQVGRFRLFTVQRTLGVGALIVCCILGLIYFAGPESFRSAVDRLNPISRFFNQEDLSLGVDLWSVQHDITDFFHPSTVVVTKYRGDQTGGVLDISPRAEYQGHNYLEVSAGGDITSALPLSSNGRTHIESIPVFLSLKLTNKSSSRGVELISANLRIKRNSAIERALLVIDRDALTKGVFRLSNEGSASATDIRLGYSVVRAGTAVERAQTNTQLSEVPPTQSVEIGEEMQKLGASAGERLMVVGEIAYLEPGGQQKRKLALDIPAGDIKSRREQTTVAEDSPDADRTFAIDLKKPGDGDPDPASLSRKLAPGEAGEIWLKITAPRWSVYEMDLYLDYNDGGMRRTPAVPVKVTFYGSAI